MRQRGAWTFVEPSCEPTAVASATADRTRLLLGAAETRNGLV